MKTKLCLVQCRFQKLDRDKGTMIYQTRPLPKEHAIVGKKIKIKIDGEWDKGWEVVNVWEGE